MRQAVYVMCVVAMVVLTAGCLARDEHVTHRDESYLMVELVGAVRGDNGSGQAFSPDVCGSYTPFVVNGENQTIAYDQSHLEMPLSPEVVLFVHPGFAHPRTMPCSTWELHGSNGTGFTIAFSVPPFSWSENFSLANTTLIHNEVEIGPGESWQVTINETREDIHYTGFLEVRNLGPWPQSGIDHVASQEEFLAKYRG